MSRKLDDLHPAFRPAAFELIARLTESLIPVMIITTSRTQSEQEDAVRRGVSWTRKSKHLHGLAIDLCPYDQFQLHGPDKLKWDDSDPVWQRMGAVATNRLPVLVWGVRFKDGRHGDLGHFEWPTWENTQ